MLRIRDRSFPLCHIISTAYFTQLAVMETVALGFIASAQLPWKPEKLGKNRNGGKLKKLKT
jgi:hypothetical protein